MLKKIATIKPFRKVTNQSKGLILNIFLFQNQSKNQHDTNLHLPLQCRHFGHHHRLPMHQLGWQIDPSFLLELA